MEQLSCVHHRLSVGVPPCADFSLFGLFCGAKARGVQIQSNGELAAIEVFGPPDLATWMKSLDVLCTALAGCEAVSLGALLDYRGKVHELAMSSDRRPGCTCTVSMERLRRNISSEVTCRPWDVVWRQAVEHNRSLQKGSSSSLLRLKQKSYLSGQALDMIHERGTWTAESLISKGDATDFHVSTKASPLSQDKHGTDQAGIAADFGRIRQPEGFGMHVGLQSTSAASFSLQYCIYIVHDCSHSYYSQP